jgi:hypothetical protein
LWKNVQRDRLQQALEREGGGSEQAGTGQATSSSSSTTNKGAPYSGPHDDPMKG